jgi:hypothetical protein
MADSDLALIVQRLDRIERRLGAIGDLISPVADPPPDDLVRLRPDIFQRRLIDLIRDVIIKGDPPPFDFTRFRAGGVAGGATEAGISDIFRRIRWIADPPPEDLWNLRLRDLIARIPGAGGGVADPAPDDIARLSKAEVEGLVHQVNAELVRLQSVEKLLNERLASFEQ